MDTDKIQQLTKVLDDVRALRDGYSEHESQWFTLDDAAERIASAIQYEVNKP